MSRLRDLLERVGRSSVQGTAEIGFAASLFGESLFWLVMGRRRGQAVRLRPIVSQMVEIGINAIPIVTVLAATIGLMLAIQGIYTLRTFGAEQRVTLGIALSVVREFAPLITGILVAGRSGSAIAARLGTMQISQEIDALQVMGISPVRFLVVPALVAMVVMVPSLTIWSALVSLVAAGFYVVIELGFTFGGYLGEVAGVLRVQDIAHGLGKSAIFAVLITLVGVLNGAIVKGGAEGVGRATTRSVVHAISALVVTDMIFAFLVTR